MKGHTATRFNYAFSVSFLRHSALPREESRPLNVHKIGFNNTETDVNPLPLHPPLGPPPLHHHHHHLPSSSSTAAAAAAASSSAAEKASAQLVLA